MTSNRRELDPMHNGAKVSPSTPLSCRPKHDFSGLLSHIQMRGCSIVQRHTLGREQSTNLQGPLIRVGHASVIIQGRGSRGLEGARSRNCVTRIELRQTLP